MRTFHCYVPVTKYQYPTQVATLKTWERKGVITLFQNELLQKLSGKIQSSSHTALRFYNHEVLEDRSSQLFSFF